VILASDPVQHLLIPLERTGLLLDPEPLDVIFPAIHGTYGEDGTLQGLLEMAGIPYVGCGVLGSSLGMDKEKMKMIIQADHPGHRTADSPLSGLPPLSMGTLTRSHNGHN
jgi:D-alanine-D-alanine ligase